MHKRGWSVYPQEREGKRMPSRVNDKVLEWGLLREERATRKEMDEFCRDAANANVAIALGPASGHTFAVDVDCTDADVSARIQEIAREILGDTPFCRIGRAPKAVLIYRYDPAEAAPRAQQHRLRDYKDCMLEILGGSSTVTMFGLHHETGRWFQWEGRNPMGYGPEEAPLVRAEQLRAFVDAVRSEFPFAATTSTSRDVAPSLSAPQRDVGSATPPTAAWRIGEERDDLVLPPAWQGEKLVDGRESFLRDLAWNLVRLNGRKLLAARDEGTLPALRARIEQAAIRVFEDACELSGRWSDDMAWRMAEAKVRSALEKLMSGNMVLPEEASAASASVSEDGPITDAERFRFRVDIETARTQPRPHLDFVLPGLLVGAVGFLVSPGGAGKSFLALELSTSIAMGRNLWGILPGDPVQGTVMFQGAEDPSEVLINRLHDLATIPNGCGIDLWRDPMLPRHLVLNAVSGENFSLGTWAHGVFTPSRAFRVMQSEAEACRPRLIVIDTLSRCLSGVPENDNGAMAAVINAVEGMLKPLRAACLILHHVGKSSARDGQGDEQHAARGAGAITDNGRWQANVVGMTAAEAAEHGVRDEDRWRWVRLVVSKVNLVERGPPRWLWRDQGGVLVARDLPKANKAANTAGASTRSYSGVTAKAERRARAVDRD